MRSRRRQSGRLATSMARCQSLSVVLLPSQRSPAPHARLLRVFLYTPRKLAFMSPPSCALILSPAFLSPGFCCYDCPGVTEQIKSVKVYVRNLRAYKSGVLKRQHVALRSQRNWGLLKGSIPETNREKKPRNLSASNMLSVWTKSSAAMRAIKEARAAPTRPPSPTLPVRRTGRCCRTGTRS